MTPSSRSTFISRRFLSKWTPSSSRPPGGKKMSSAPGSTSVIDAATIAGRPAVTPIDHLRSTGGIDIAQTGLMQQTVVSRAFNNVFSTTLTMLTDNRIAAIPSLRANIPAFIPIIDDDLERIEVVRGPASALYGPNAHNGVVNFITRSPFASKGTTFSIAGGSRSLCREACGTPERSANGSGTGCRPGYFRGLDWAYTDSAEAANRQKAIDSGAVADTLRIGKGKRRRPRFGGGSQDGLHPRRPRHGEPHGWRQSGGKDHRTDRHRGLAGNILEVYVHPGADDVGSVFSRCSQRQRRGRVYILRTGLPVVDRSRMFVAKRPELVVDRRTRTADLRRRLEPDPARHRRHDHRPEREGRRHRRDRRVRAVGNAGRAGLLNLVLATRADYNNRLEDVVFSPRAAVVYHPDERRSFRLTYNRAYSTPKSPTELFLDIIARDNFLPAPVPDEYLDIRGSGVPRDGYFFARDGNGRPMTHSQFNPPGLAGHERGRRGPDLARGRSSRVRSLRRRPRVDACSLALRHQRTDRQS